MDAYLNELDELERVGRAQAEAARPEFYAEMRRRFAEARERMGMEPLPATDEEMRESAAGSPHR